MPQHLEELIATAKHELSHALVAWALRSVKFTIRVYKAPQKDTAKVRGVGPAEAKECQVKCMGFCQSSYPKEHYSLFITAGPFGSPLYQPSESDFLEFQGLVAKYRSLTRQPVKTFNTFVLEPVKNLLDCGPATAIIQRIAPALAQGGTIKAATYLELERFFPRDLNRPLLDAMARQVREAADDYPFDNL